MTAQDKKDESEMDEGQRAIIREIAFQVAGQIATDLKAHFATQIELHKSGCPVKVKVEATLSEAKGAWKTVAVISAVIGAVGTWLLGHIWK